MRLINIIAFLVVTFLLYVMYSSFDYEFKLAKFAGMKFEAPEYYALITSTTFAICFLVGLPIRNIDSLGRKWNRTIWTRIIPIIVGISFVIYSMFKIERFDYRIDGLETYSFGPNSFFQITGWMLISFTAMHLSSRTTKT